MKEPKPGNLQPPPREKPWLFRMVQEHGHVHTGHILVQQKHPEMKAKRLPSDIITTLPQTVIETILCLLPVEEAARTSILSREWRYKWTKIPKLEFSMSTFILYENFDDEEYPNIIELFTCLPMIEHLTTWAYMVELLVSDWVPEELPTSLIHLRYLCIERMDFDNCNGLDFLRLLMKCSPNLGTIKLEIDRKDHCAELDSDEVEEYSATLEEYSDVCLEHLNELDIKNFRNLKPELDFVKFILARSPNLKKVILLTYINDKNEELEMSKILLRAPRASPVEIVVENIYKECDDDED
ncbi:hypothetical protein SSX86_028739 [Deinandra increscens subsp. villosa]|uniref:FBD domain-containing protein n=1 Tax=Deinandra increscens subsp. villosa TaxID=3103831 RepID=A0AAP0GJY6_9ASTR